jgi:signal transduction histidine kinase
MSDFTPGNKHARWAEPAVGAPVSDPGVQLPGLARVAVLPTAAMAVLGVVAAVLLAHDHSTGMIVAVVVGGVILGGLVLGWAAGGARDAARAIHGQVGELAIAANEAKGAAGALHHQFAGLQQLHAELQQAYEAAISWPAQFCYHIEQFAARVRNGERPPVHGAPAGFADDRDPLARLGREHRAAQLAAESAVLQAAEPNLDVDADPVQRLQVFANLGRRLQSLVNREIQMLDELEKQIEDPEILEGIFAVDHLATRIRRQAENLGVLGGARAPRQWTKPLTMVTTLRSAMQEVEHYKRVKMVSPINGTLRGHNVTEIIHLLAELIENATAFSDPDTTVMLSAQNVTAGLAIEVEDRGLGIKSDDLERINDLLAGPEINDAGVLLSDGRQIGLWVVAQLARRNDVKVRLARNIFGGTTAAVVVPHSLLGEGADNVVGHDTRRELVVAGAAPAPAWGAPGGGAHHLYSLTEDSGQHVFPPLPEEYPAPVHAEPLADLDQHRWPDNAGELAIPADVPAEISAATPEPTDDRPPLPKRQPGVNHLALELRNPPPTAPATTRLAAAGEHNSGAAAAFRSGIRAGSSEDIGEPAERVSSQGEPSNNDR